jgi:hypothetical protein
VLNDAVKHFGYVHNTKYQELPLNVRTYFFNENAERYMSTPYPASEIQVHYFKPNKQQELAGIIAKSKTT